MNWFTKLFRREKERTTQKYHTLREGDVNDNVEDLQVDLALNLGDICPFRVTTADGIFGPKTKAAVQLFQKKYGLVEDGIAGSLTLGMLASVSDVWIERSEGKNIPEEKEPTSNLKSLTCPFANQDYSMKTKGKFKEGYPKGAVIHFTAGSTGTGSLNYGKSQGYAFWLIDRAGTVFQTHPLNRWGYHAGKSYWKGLGSSLSDELLGIEIANAGMLTKISENNYKSWFGKSYTKDEVRYSSATENIQAGYYEKYTKEQEKSLEELLIWLKENNPSVFSYDNVLGHDEIAPKRKNDPGAALSSSMPILREKLNNTSN